MGVRIRRLRAGDVAAVVGIERRITGSRRTSALGLYLRHALRTREGICLVAEADGEAVGFLVGDVRPWEFGEDREVAWVKVVGVDPRHQGEGLGHRMGEQFLKELRRSGIRRVKTLVEWDSGDLVAYFQSLGFNRGGAIVLERTF
jgi:predicted N-acetyltransferase YhbS